MTVKDTEAARQVQRVAASMAIENMPLSKEFICKLIDAAEGKRSYDDLIQEVLNEYTRK